MWLKNIHTKGIFPNGKKVASGDTFQASDSTGKRLITLGLAEKYKKDKK